MHCRVHDRALCESEHVGSGTSIGAFAHVLRDARIGADCTISDNVVIENDVVLGDRVRVDCGVQLSDGVRIQDDVIVRANATFAHDPDPGDCPETDGAPHTVVSAGARIGANATILPGIVIGRNAVIRAGSVVAKSVPAHAIVEGNPGRIVGYAGAESPAPAVPAEVGEPDISSRFRMHRLRKAVDMRGGLVAAEFSDLPFVPRRTFVVYNVPSREVRGEHAHRVCEQFLVCLRGSVNVLADDGVERREFILDDPSLGLHLRPMTWGTQYKYSLGSVLMVFASHPYDDADYIRDYDEFMELVASARSGLPGSSR